MLHIISKISKTKVQKTEFLNDIFTSLYRSIKTGDIHLQKSIFIILQGVNQVFSSKVNEDNEHTLDLYELQFLSVIKVGFLFKLAVSDGYLLCYLVFNTDNMLMKLEFFSVVIFVYMAGLDKFSQLISAPFGVNMSKFKHWF